MNLCGNTVNLFIIRNWNLLQLTKLKLAFSCIFKKQDNDAGDISSFQVLCIALFLMIRTGNIVGVATAIAVGGAMYYLERGLGVATAKTNSCVEQGLVSMTGTFIDTIVICTMTGFAINSHTGKLAGAATTTLAFNKGLFILEVGKYIVNVGLIFFTFTTIIGWNYYGERCIFKGIKSNPLL